MKIADQLIANGYRQWGQRPYLFKEHAETSYQKWVRDEEGNKLYALTAFLYDFSHIKNMPDELKKDLSAQWEVQFKKSNGFTFDISVSYANVEEADKFFADMYKTMNCLPYDDY